MSNEVNEDMIEVIKWFHAAGVNNISVENHGASMSVEHINDLPTLRQMVEQVECDLKDTALNMVFGDGNEKSKIVFIGEAPGADEDKAGLPFVGQSGQLLTKAINSISLDRKDVYITNIIPWRPIGNRTPTNAEVELYRPYLIQHVKIISPKIVVCLGSTAVRAVLQKNTGISSLRGRWLSGQETFGQDIKILATFHPAYLLRSPSQKKEFWRDFLKIYDELQQYI